MISPETKTAIEIILGLLILAGALAADLLWVLYEMEEKDENTNR